jgi:CheY-like chemotaxis protein
MFKKILCVDDDPITLMILKMTMKKCEFTSIVETVADGTEAVRYYEGLLQNPSIDAPELIFLDLNMPQMSGWAFLDVFIARFQKYFPATKLSFFPRASTPKIFENLKRHLVSRSLSTNHPYNNTFEIKV